MSVPHPGHPPYPVEPTPAFAPVGLPPLHFGFDGGALGWLGVQIGGFLVTVLTLGICYPWAFVMQYRWKSKHTIVNGQRLRFTGTSVGLFGHWIKWFLLSVITLGIYLFWVYPRLTKWAVEHQELDPASMVR
ncbi:MAG: DUF898 domain-containing protein [Arthrobacter sp.]|jgi:uncharacterized membrane protein YjgN (DUF898 family)|nr:DUF898 domain-containing protein [Arthrobacter sp.]